MQREERPCVHVCWTNDRLFVKVKKMATYDAWIIAPRSTGISSFLRRDAARTSAFLSALFGNNKEESFLLRRRRLAFRSSNGRMHGTFYFRTGLHNHDFIIVSTGKNVLLITIFKRSVSNINFTSKALQIIFCFVLFLYYVYLYKYIENYLFNFNNCRLTIVRIISCIEFVLHFLLRSSLEDDALRFSRDTRKAIRVN